MRVSETSRKLFTIMAVVALIIIIGGALYHRSMPEVMYFALGVILTTCLNAVKLLMLERTAEKIVNLEEEARAKGAAGLQYLLRFVLTIGVFLAAAFIPLIDLFGAIFGIFTMPLSLHIWRIVSKKQGIEI